MKVEGRRSRERGVGMAVGWKDKTDKWECGMRGISRDGRVELRREEMTQGKGGGCYIRKGDNEEGIMEERRWDCRKAG